MPSVDAAAFTRWAAVALVAGSSGWIGFAANRTRVALTAVPPELAPPAATPPHVTIFDDFECAGCALLQARLGRELQALAARGVIRLEYVHAPLPTHARSSVAAAAVACVATPARAARLRELLHADRRWIHEDDPTGAVMRLALSQPDEEAARALRACMVADSTQASLAADAELGRRAGVRAVPTVWVHGQHVRFRTYGSLRRHIRSQVGTGS
jgi:protein-disulfide isomerase